MWNPCGIRMESVCMFQPSGGSGKASAGEGSLAIWGDECRGGHYGSAVGRGGVGERGGGVRDAGRGGEMPVPAGAVAAPDMARDAAGGAGGSAPGAGRGGGRAGRVPRGRAGGVVRGRAAAGVRSSDAGADDSAVGGAKDKADEGVWAVACFVTRTGFRRRGVMRALAEAAVEFARGRGARALEGYPMVREVGREVPWGEMSVGAESAFEAAGIPGGEQAGAAKGGDAGGVRGGEGRPPAAAKPDGTGG